MFSARQIMSTDLVTVRPNTPVEDMVGILEDSYVSGLPVVDSLYHLVGVVTEYDLFKAIRLHQLHGTVADFMTADVITIDANAQLDEIVDVFLSKRIRRVLVTDAGKLVGVISRRDLVVVGQARQEIIDFVAELPSETASADSECV
jgi:CBS domain-containing protein